MPYEPLPGDIFLCDSQRTGARIVKFLQAEPTVWHYLLKVIRRKPINTVRYYHAGMVLDSNTAIEQQWKVQTRPVTDILNRDIIIYRHQDMVTSPEYQRELSERALQDTGKTYDIPQIVGKLLTWITGLKIFVRLLGAISTENEICVTRVADWYWPLCHFGVRTKHEVTTHILDEYCSSERQWAVVYINKA